MSPLMYAAHNGRPGLVQLLIVKHADVNAQDMRGWTVRLLPLFLCYYVDKQGQTL